jgi:hypothetical protein
MRHVHGRTLTLAGVAAPAMAQLIAVDLPCASALAV